MHAQRPGRNPSPCAYRKGTFMIIERTPEQQRKLDDLLARIRNDYISKLDAQDTSEARSALMMEIQDAIDTFKREEEEEAFKALRGDHKAILDNARAQVGLITKQIKEELLSFGTDEYRDDLERVEILKKKDGAYYISALYMFSVIREELRLHREALQENKQETDAFNKIIADAVVNCPYVDKEDMETAARLELSAIDTATIKKKIGHRTALDTLKNFWLMSSKTTNSITLNMYDFLETSPDGQLTMKWQVDQSAENKKPVPTTVFLTNTDKELSKELRGPQKNIKPFDRAVMDTIGSAFKTWEYAHPGEPLHISPTALFRLMKGRQPGDKTCRVSDKQREELAASIRKLSATEFTIDIKAEVNAKYLDEEGLALLEDSGKLKGYYLTDRLVDAIALGAFDENGRRTPVEFVFSRKPILCTYCEAKGQYLSVPFDVLDVFADKNVTEYAIEVRNYLIMQIENLKNPKGYRRNNKILWETLYKSTGMKDPQTRVELREEGDRNGENKVVYASNNSRKVVISKERAKDKALVENILKAWVQKGYIKSFKIDSISIEIDPGKPTGNTRKK